jgi:hypothetical protein
MTRANHFEHGLDCVPGFRRIEQRETVKATEGDEVESFSFLKPFQTVRHGSIIAEFWPDPKTRSSR